MYHVHKLSQDPFFKSFPKIKTIEVIKNKNKDTKTIYIFTYHKEPIEIEINKANQMIRYKNPHIRKLPDNFLSYNRYLNVLELNNVTKAGKNCFYFNTALQYLSLEKVYEIGENFLYRNKSIKRAIFPKYFFINDGFLGWNKVWDPQPAGVKNTLANKIKDKEIYIGIFELFHLLSKVIMKQTIKISNKLIDKQQMDFKDDNIKIVSIKRSNAISHLIDFVISKQNLNKGLIEEKGKTK
jgi:hypothetical protein